MRGERRGAPGTPDRAHGTFTGNLSSVIPNVPPMSPLHATVLRLAAPMSLALAVCILHGGARPLHAQAVPVVEVVMPFDNAGRITVLTPLLVSRLGLTASAAYNVTAGDASMVLTSAVLGGVALSAAAGNDPEGPALFGTAAAGLVAGALFGDRVFARKADRTVADGTLARIGAFAGALMGAGVAALAETEAPGALALASAGGLLGMLTADQMIAPPKDAGPLRGVMPTSSRASAERVTFSLGPVTSLRVTF